MVKPKPKPKAKPKKAPRLALPKGAVVTWEDPTALGGTKSKPVVTEVGIKLITKLSKSGWPLYGIANILGLKRDVFQDVRKRQPEAQAAVDKGRSDLQAELVYHLLEAARGGAFVPAMFLLKSLCGVREAGPTDGGAAPLVAITIPQGMSRDDFEKMIDITPKKVIDAEFETLPEPKGITR